MGSSPFGGEPVDGGESPFHQFLGNSDLFPVRGRVDQNLILHRQQAHVDAEQRLGDFIMEGKTQRMALLFLLCEKPAGESLQRSIAPRQADEFVFFHVRSTSCRLRLWSAHCR